MPRISAVEVVHVRFPTPDPEPGSEATVQDGAQSAAYVVVMTDTGVSGHHVMFTGGPHTDLYIRAARHVAGPLVGRDVDELAGSLGPMYRWLVENNQWGSERGIGRLAAVGVLNAIWDLVARHAGKPLWSLVAQMEPADLVAACDFRDLSDVLSRHEAQEILERLAPSRAERISHLARVGYPAYISAPGGLGYNDDRLRRLCRDAAASGWRAIRIEVGRSVGETRRRLAIARKELGPDGTLLIDTRQIWGVLEAINQISELAQFGPLWIGTPTSPDDIAGHAEIRAAVAPLGVSTGGQCHDRVVFKQMLSAGALDFCQVDLRRLGSVNEIVPVLLMAARFGVPVTYRGGGVGLTELAQHMAVVDFVCASGSLVGRLLEHVDVPHGPIDSPTVVNEGWYQLPVEPGYSARMKPRSIATYRYPDGAHWRRALALR